MGCKHQENQLIQLKNIKKYEKYEIWTNIDKLRKFLDVETFGLQDLKFLENNKRSDLV